LVRDYRAIETAAESAAKSKLRALEAALKKTPPKSAEPRKTSIKGRTR
jgi:hypothetical protein